MFKKIFKSIFSKSVVLPLIKETIDFCRKENKLGLVTQDIEYKVLEIDSEMLSFDKKRSKLLQKILEYYQENFIESNLLIERKRDMKIHQKLSEILVFPIATGLIASIIFLIGTKIFGYFMNQDENGVFILPIIPTVLLGAVFGFACSVYYTSFLVKMRSPTLYQSYDLEDYEISIINSILDNRLQENK